DPVELQPQRLALVRRRRHERLPVPPRRSIWVIRLHRDVGKVPADRVSDTRKLPQIYSEERIRQGLVLHQRCHHRRRNRNFVVPPCRNKLPRGDGLSFSLNFQRRLQSPTLAQRQLVPCRSRRRGLGLSGACCKQKCRNQKE